MKTNKLPINTKQKKHFLLIEILIALAILSMLTFPLIRNPLHFCISQIQSLEKMECERIADLTFLDIKLAMMTKEIDPNSIPKYEGHSPKISLSPYYLKTLKNKEVKRSYKLYAKKEKKAVNDQTIKLVNVKIYLQPKALKKPYEYKYKIVTRV